jgi:MFS family permease
VTSPSAHSVFSHGGFVRFQIARFVSTVGTQIASVAVGWQVYELTHRKIDLGYVGLAQFVPVIGLSLVAGAVADRFERRYVVAVCHFLFALCFVALWGLCTTSIRTPAPIYAVLLMLGVARAFVAPANQALLPGLVPKAQFASALAMGSSLWQIAAIAGPALGGLLWAPLRGSVFALSAGCSLLSGILVLSLQPRVSETPPRRATSVHELFAGVRYVWNQKLILGAVSLDLFAVLLGGAVALLPVFASDILHVGATGMGMLRSAPAVGAAAMALWLAYNPLGRHAGRVMLVSVAVFGVATLVFGWSQNIVISLVALAVTGAADMVSVVVRQNVVQLSTPDEMRGRVSAVSQVFISTSNELGEFESGVTAEIFGPVRAVALGGIGTVLVVALWAWMFPSLRRFEPQNHQG